jgi:glycogen debranching enzyme
MVAILLIDRDTNRGCLNNLIGGVVTDVIPLLQQAFWMDEPGFLAMGLDAQKRPIRSVGSNAGHRLAAGITDAALVCRTADRLMADDLFTGWGIRTLSARHPAYNPYSYHRGSVWSVEQGTFAIGFTRHGLYEHTERLCRAQFEAVTLFE